MNSRVADSKIAAPELSLPRSARIRLCLIFILGAFLLVSGIFSSADALLHYSIAFHLFPGDAHAHSQGLLGLPMAWIGFGMLRRREWARTWAWFGICFLVVIFVLGTIAALIGAHWLGSAAAATCATALYFGHRFLNDDRTRLLFR